MTMQKRLFYNEARMKKVGYARVSTIDQTLDLQKDALEKAGCVRVFSETASGAKDDRPELAKCLAHLDKGDCLVVWRLDRLGRSLKHLIGVVDDLRERGVGFQSLQEGFDTTTSGGTLVFSIFGAMAEFERNLIKERTKAGLESARARGRMGGRKEKLTEKQVKTMKAMYDSKDHGIGEICSTFKITRPTFYRYLKIKADKTTPLLTAGQVVEIQSYATGEGKEDIAKEAGKDLTDNHKWIECKICGSRVTFIELHLSEVHKDMVITDYIKTYPDSPLMSSEASRLMELRMPGYLDTYMKPKS